MRLSWLCAASAMARHQVQRSLMLGFAHSPGTWPTPSSPAGPSSRQVRSGSSRHMSNGFSSGLFPNARTLIDAGSKGEARCSAVSRSAGDAEHFSGGRILTSFS
jgi:hypothetical protein